MNYEGIKVIAKQVGCNVPDLLALSRNNDPFYVGSPTHKAMAEWFAELWISFSYTTGVHLRRVHYRLVNQKEPPRLYNGEPYENKLTHFKYLCDAGRYARILGLVEAEAFVDQRNPTPRLYMERPWWWQGNGVGWEYDWDGDSEALWRLPGIDTDLAQGLRDITPPTLTPTGYEYDDLLQPYHVEVWAEKSTMNDVLNPLCRHTATNLVTGVGYLSITAVVKLLRERVYSLKKPCRILYVSDFDPSGENMPTQAGRQIEYWLSHYGDDADIRLEPAILSAGQVARYDLTPIPIKDTDHSKAKFEARYGEASAVELDALEAEHPGELRRILEERIAGFRDDGMRAKVEAAREEAEEVLADELDEATGGALIDLGDIKREATQVYERYRERLEALSAEMEGELAPLRERLEGVRHAIHHTLEDLNPDLPGMPHPETNPDEEGWLFDSRRDYLEQLEHYKRRKAG